MGGGYPCCCGATGDCSFCLTSNTQQWHVDIPGMTRNVVVPGTGCGTSVSPTISADLPPLDEFDPGVQCTTTVSVDSTGWDVAVSSGGGFVCESATAVTLTLRLYNLGGTSWWLVVELIVTSASGSNTYGWDKTFTESSFDCVVSTNMEDTFGQDLLLPTGNGAYLDSSVSATTSRI